MNALWIWKCWGCGCEVIAAYDLHPRCPIPKCGIFMDRVAEWLRRDA